MNKILQEDVQSIIENFDMSKFANCTFLITGATGLIGKLCVKSLLAAKQNIKVIALVRNEEKAKKILGNNDNLTILVQDINTEISLEQPVDYIIHGASSTSSKDFVEKPVETIYTAFNGTRNVLEFSKKYYPKSIVYLSSLEVYGVPADEYVSEDMYGYIDILSPRSSYSESKKLVETLCISYGAEYHVPVKIARLSQTFGAGVLSDDNRVFAQFARSIINQENIILHTKGETKRNYCYTTDAIRGIFTILSKGQNNQAYNVANVNTYISIAEMAKMLENDVSKTQFKIDNINRGYNPFTKICLKTDKLEALGWKPLVDLKQMYERLIESLKEDNNA